MEYNSNIILKIEHIFHIPKNKGQKRCKSNIYFEKIVFYFSIPFSPHLIANKRFSCLNKILYLCLLIVMVYFNFLPQKKDT